MQDNNASSTGIFGVPSDYYKVTIETHPWQEEFVTDVYVKHFQGGRVSQGHEEFLSTSPHDAHNVHVQAQNKTRELGPGYFTGFDTFKVETSIQEPLEISVDKKDHREVQQEVRAKTKEPDTSDPGKPQTNQAERIDPSNGARADNTESQTQPKSEGDGGLDWGLAAKSAAESLAMGLGVGLATGGLLAAGVVSVPVLAGAGLGLGIVSLFSNANEAKDAGAEVSLSKALTKTVSGMIPGDPVTLLEVGYNYNYMTEQEMTQEERSKKAGSLAGNLAGAAVVTKTLKAKGSNAKKPSPPKQTTKPSVAKAAPDFDRYELMPRAPNFENHHIALKAIFLRAKSPLIREVYYELRAVPLSLQTHKTIHRIVNNALRREGLMPGSTISGTLVEFEARDVERALEILARTYRQQGITDFAEHVEGLINAMRSAGMFK